MSKLLTSKELAARWGITLRTLQDWERRGKGPKRTVLGPKAIRYSMTDVLAHEQANSMTKTTEGKDHE